MSPEKSDLEEIVELAERTATEIRNLRHRVNGISTRIFVLAGMEAILAVSILFMGPSLFVGDTAFTREMTTIFIFVSMVLSFVLLFFEWRRLRDAQYEIEVERGVLEKLIVLADSELENYPALSRALFQIRLKKLYRR